MHIDEGSHPARRALLLGLTTFGILALELAVIRWMSHQIRVFAYLNNVLLMAAFLGMGLGVGLGRKTRGLVRWTLPALALLATVLSFSETLGIMRVNFPDPTFSLWGAEWRTADTRFILSLLLVMALFSAVAIVFVFAGTLVGELFSKMVPLKAYSADLLGSLGGVLAMAAASAIGTSPPVWFAIGAIPFLWISRRRWEVWLSFAVIVIVSWIAIDGARFSPYYRIDVYPDPATPSSPLVLSANRDHHQFLLDLSDRRLGDPTLTTKERAHLSYMRRMYDLPFGLSREHDDALVVGAGTGNDVAAALRAGFDHVVSVDIDPVILRIGREIHPEKPYESTAVEWVTNDARAYLETTDTTFDVVCFGLLDSHAMFASMSSLRLDNYVYTVESMRSAWEHVADGGVMSVSFSVYAGPWMKDRIAALLETAIGQKPLVFWFPNQYAAVYVLGKGFDVATAARDHPELTHSAVDPEKLRIPTDDWPFLYLRPHTFPWGYIAVLGGILLLTVIGTRVVFGRSMMRRGSFDVPLFFMGAAFLLIETRGITDLSLLFGSTWIVNASVFAGVLVVVWLANHYVISRRPADVRLYFIPLILSLLVLYFVRPTFLLELPMLGRGVLGGLVNAIPIGFAGVIFSMILARSSDPSASLGSNLLGALLGGTLEYLSILTGLQALTLLGLALYLIALVTWMRRSEKSQKVD